MAIDWSWVGGVTDTTAVVSIGSDAAITSAELRLSTDDFATSTDYDDQGTVTTYGGHHCQLSATGLTANTHYKYRIVRDATEDSHEGEFWTTPAALTPQGYSFVHASCAALGDLDTGDAEGVHLYCQPGTFIQNGDIHYWDDASASGVDVKFSFIEGQVERANWNKVVRQQNAVYVYDDHDYGSNTDWDEETAGRENVSDGARAISPRYEDLGSYGLRQSFQVGRIYVIILDVRTDRQQPLATAPRTMLGTTQLAWFKDELDAARDEGYAAVIVVSSSMWHCSGIQNFSEATEDSWFQYSDEREEISDYLNDGTLRPQTLIIQGDQHTPGRLSHVDYSTGFKSNPVDVYNAAPMQSTTTATVRGYNWDGSVTSGGDSQYGHLLITDGPDGTSSIWRTVSQPFTANAIFAMRLTTQLNEAPSVTPLDSTEAAVSMTHATDTAADGMRILL